jgi:hypothetical protein
MSGGLVPLASQVHPIAYNTNRHTGSQAPGLPGWWPLLIHDAASPWAGIFLAAAISRGPSTEDTPAAQLPARALSHHPTGFTTGHPVPAAVECMTVALADLADPDERNSRRSPAACWHTPPSTHRRDRDRR